MQWLVLTLGSRSGCQNVQTKSRTFYYYYLFIIYFLNSFNSTVQACTSVCNLEIFDPLPQPLPENSPLFS